MRSNDVLSVQPDGPFGFRAVCPKCDARYPAGVEICDGHGCSPVASRHSEVSTIVALGAGALCLVMLYFTAGLMGIVVTLGIVGLCLIA
jgi:hypothetical protein